MFEDYPDGYAEDRVAHPGAGSPRPAHTGIGRRTAWLLVTVVVVLAAIALLNLVNVPYVVYRPGPVHNTLGEAPGGLPMIRIEGAPTYDTSGALDFTTVSVFGGPRYPVSAWDYLWAHLEPAASIVPERLVFPDDVTAEEVERQNTVQMVGSQEEAAVVALRALGETVPEDVTVVQVVPDAPSGDVFREGDVILSVGGEEATTAGTVSDLLQEYEPGEEVPVVVERDGEELELQVPTGESDGRVVVGVLLQSEFELPVEVEIDPGEVGGPSAGMMFALGVYDKLTPGQLTDGEEIAGTGTIDSSGDVGPIGGIRQKLIGAQEAGADYFLAPARNCEEVVGHIPDGLQVARVSDFEGALDAVEQIAAGETAELPTC